MSCPDAVEVEESPRRPVLSPRAHGQSTETISTSFRAHPYSRRPSLPTHDTEHSSRIHLPPPTVGGQLRSEVPRQTPAQSQPISIPSISTLVSDTSSWRREAERERFWDDRVARRDPQDEPRPPIGRSVSGETAQSARPSLPPLHTLGVSEPTSNTPTPTSVNTPLSIPPPIHRKNPPSPHFAYSRQSTPPPPPPSGRISAGATLHHPQDPRHYPSDRPIGRRGQTRDASPPLRALHGSYDASPLHHQNRFSEAYHPHQSLYRGPQGHRLHPQLQVDPYTGRPLGHPGPSPSMTMRRHDDERHAGPPGPVPGQSRRLAHLMSEQKRRESINTGFQALRKVVPAATATDSKAVILRKAAAHIAHLDALVRNGAGGGSVTNRIMELDERVGSGSDECLDVDEEDEDGSDNGRDLTVVKVEETPPRW